jgi:biopolymer transport protein ExbB/TolQ
MTVADPSHPPTAAANLANSVTLLLISRGAVIVAPIILSAIAWLSLQYLDGRFREQTIQVEAVQARANNIEGAAVVASDKAAKVADDLTATKQSLSDEQRQMAQFRHDTKEALDKHSDALTSISNTLAGLSVKIDTWHQQGRP